MGDDFLLIVGLIAAAGMALLVCVTLVAVFFGGGT